MSNLNLFNIETEYRLLAEQIIEAGGELTPQLEAALVINQEQLQAKAQGYAMVIREAEYELNIIKAETERLAEHKAKREALIQKLKDRVSEAMILYEINEIKTPTLTINFRKSKTVEIIDEKLIPKEFMAYPLPPAPKPDKKALKAAIEGGEIIGGAEIVEHKNLQIK